MESERENSELAHAILVTNVKISEDEDELEQHVHVHEHEQWTCNCTWTLTIPATNVDMRDKLNQNYHVIVKPQEIRLRDYVAINNAFKR